MEGSIGWREGVPDSLNRVVTSSINIPISGLWSQTPYPVCGFEGVELLSIVHLFMNGRLLPSCFLFHAEEVLRVTVEIVSDLHRH